MHLAYKEISKLPVDRWISENNDSKNKNFISKFLTSRKIKKEMVATGLAKAGNLDILSEYKSLQSNLLSIQIQGLYIISKVKEIQSSLIEEQYLHFHSLMDVYHQAQSSLIDVEEKAKPYEGDNILDDMSCDSNHILKRKEEARRIRDCIMLGCAQVKDPASFMKFVRKELIENGEFVSSSPVVSKLSDFNEKALVFEENLKDFVDKAHYKTNGETSLDELVQNLQNLQSVHRAFELGVCGKDRKMTLHPKGYLKLSVHWSRN